MRRPALRRTHLDAASAWAHPYRGRTEAHAVFYNSGGEPTPAPVPTPADLARLGQPPAPAPQTPTPAPAGDDEEKVTLTQRRLNVIMRDEKDEGRRAAYRALAEAAGVPVDDFDPETFGKLFKQADEARKAQLSEEQRRAEELAQRERDLEARLAEAENREKEAARRDRESQVRAALVRLGATGDDLDDAYALLRDRIPADADADAAAITQAAEQLKERRATLFGGTAPVPPLPPAPSGAPAGGPPHRTAPAGKDALRAAARQRAIEMGLRTDDAA
ncbi:hypothetical protein [Streptomyces sp. DH12]|uniref:hypothetical protein n=1 Tax=Streptomyces sp. DH12 TaxID=2857010 RepID=UPI001E47804B|nr:hypothetical protein [Streptomyces sp. DH12]